MLQALLGSLDRGRLEASPWQPQTKSRTSYGCFFTGNLERHVVVRAVESRLSALLENNAIRRGEDLQVRKGGGACQKGPCARCFPCEPLRRPRSRPRSCASPSSRPSHYRPSTTAWARCTRSTLTTGSVPCTCGRPPSSSTWVRGEEAGMPRRASKDRQIFYLPPSLSSRVTRRRRLPRGRGHVLPQGHATAGRGGAGHPRLPPGGACAGVLVTPGGRVRRPRVAGACSRGWDAACMRWAARPDAPAPRRPLSTPPSRCCGAGSGLLRAGCARSTTWTWADDDWAQVVSGASRDSSNVSM